MIGLAGVVRLDGGAFVDRVDFFAVSIQQHRGDAAAEVRSDFEVGISPVQFAMRAQNCEERGFVAGGKLGGNFGKRS